MSKICQGAALNQRSPSLGLRGLQAAAGGHEGRVQGRQPGCQLREGRWEGRVSFQGRSGPAAKSAGDAAAADMTQSSLS